MEEVTADGEGHAQSINNNLELAGPHWMDTVVSVTLQVDD